MVFAQAQGNSAKGDRITPLWKSGWMMMKNTNNLNLICHTHISTSPKIGYTKIPWIPFLEALWRHRIWESTVRGIALPHLYRIKLPFKKAYPYTCLLFLATFIFFPWCNPCFMLDNQPTLHPAPSKHTWSLFPSARTYQFLLNYTKSKFKVNPQPLWLNMAESYHFVGPEIGL